MPSRLVPASFVAKGMSPRPVSDQAVMDADVISMPRATGTGTTLTHAEGVPGAHGTWVHGGAGGTISTHNSGTKEGSS